MPNASQMFNAAQASVHVAGMPNFNNLTGVWTYLQHWVDDLTLQWQTEINNIQTLTQEL